jgi:hypothetical protein
MSSIFNYNYIFVNLYIGEAPTILNFLLDGMIETTPPPPPKKKKLYLYSLSIFPEMDYNFHCKTQGD